LISQKTWPEDVIFVMKAPMTKDIMEGIFSDV